MTRSNLASVPNEDPPVERQTYTVPEAATMLGVSKEMLYKAAAKGKLPHIRFGKRVLIPRSVVHKILAEGTVLEDDDDE